MGGRKKQERLCAPRVLGFPFCASLGRDKTLKRGKSVCTMCVCVKDCACAHGGKKQMFPLTERTFCTMLLVQCAVMRDACVEGFKKRFIVGI
jgi:hypothetical protein